MSSPAPKNDWTLVNVHDKDDGATVSVFSADKTVEFFKESQKRKNSQFAKEMRQALRDELSHAE